MTTSPISFLVLMARVGAACLLVTGIYAAPSAAAMARARIRVNSSISKQAKSHAPATWLANGREELFHVSGIVPSGWSENLLGPALSVISHNRQVEAALSISHETLDALLSRYLAST